MGGDQRYLNWVRTQPCMACGGPGPCEAHHALCGTTYSPEEARPSKAIEGARKGKAQRSHDHFAFSLHLRCHAQFHRGTGLFADWTSEQRDAWERDCVSKSRNRFAMQAPVPVPMPGKRPHTRSAGGGSRERELLIEQIADWAGARRLKDHEHQLIHDLINDLRAQQPGTEF